MRTILVETIDWWLGDPDSSVEYAEELEGRWAVRMRQQARDATTVWFTPQDRSLSFEAYVMPLPEAATAAYRQALVRNGRSWRAFFALDREDGLVIRGRLSADRVTREELDRVLGEIYEMVEVSFRPLLRVTYEKRENSG